MLVADEWERLGANGVTSYGGGTPPIMAAMAAPVAGPVVKPMCWLPKASHSPACRGAGPIIGRLSGSVGREPRHASPTASPNSATARRHSEIIPQNAPAFVAASGRSPDQTDSTDWSAFVNPVY